ncbi:MAG: OmpA family protein [Saprospiraceae bacterium]|nr:OmpA family protein [Saprospiraceae bacterium]
MVRRIFTLSVTLLVGLSLSAQEMSISDNQTIDPEQNKEWRMGKNPYSAKPKDAWELGIHAGHFFIDGDVDPKQPGGFGLGLHIRKAIHYSFSLRGDLFYGQAKGLDPQAWSGPGLGGGLLEEEYVDYRNAAWFPSYKTSYFYGALQGVLNIGNILFHKPSNKWNWYMAVGVGLDNHNAKLDLFNGTTPYSNIVSAVGWTPQKFDTKSGRKEIKSAIKDIYDGEYETAGPQKKGIFRLGDKTNIHAVFTASMGISRKINDRINLGLEHQIMVTDNDFLDGIRFRSAVDQTNQNDMGHYTNLRLGINLGDKEKVTEPLYWLNPLGSTMNDIAELKQRPVLDLTDSDGDGIIDMLDQEKDSPAGAVVDTRGVTLDSDGDGIADYKDKEPYSAPGFEVDGDGVAKGVVRSEADVLKLMDARAAQWCEDCKKGMSECGKWFLPMIHYDLNSSKLKPEFYGHLHHVASVMKMCPNTCVTVIGHTDDRSSTQYNEGLSYRRAQTAIDYLVSNYGIDRSRFKLMYDGEEMPLIKSSRRDKEHYMNRRVEFRVCMPDDAEMGAPASASPSGTGSRSGSTIRGDKNSGF